MTVTHQWTSQFSKQERRRLGRGVAVRVAFTTLALFGMYFLFPAHHTYTIGSLALLTIGLLALVAVLVRQVRKILVAQYPMLQAVEALGIAIPLLIVVFALTYFLMAFSRAGSFSEPLTKMDSLYFTITTLATVGYGDITPVSNYARMVASVQMLLDLVLIGALARVLFGAAQHGQASRQPSEPGAADTQGPAGNPGVTDPT